MLPSITAIVPMRHASERVPGKNYRPFGGAPLYHRIISTLLDCPEIGQVVIDTDSPRIQSDAFTNFPNVRIVERPAHLRDGTTSMNDVLMNTTSVVDSELYLQTHSTNPLLRAETVSHGIREFVNSDYDSLFSVTRIQSRLWDRDVNPINHDPAVLLRTQDLPPVYLENSCMYLFDRATLVETGNRIGKRPMMFEIDPAEAVDIDNELDFRIAESIYLDSRRATQAAVA